MKTEIVKINPKDPEPEIIERAAKIILNGGLVAFPTDTLYGLGANFFDVYSVRRVYEVKERPSEKALIALIGCIDDLYSLVSEVPPVAKKLIDKYWPAPLTIIFPASGQVPKPIIGGGKTIAVRMPASRISLALLQATRVPLTSPSANLSGGKPPTSAQEVYEQLNGRIDLILDGGISEQKFASTLVDITQDPPKILRQGEIILDEIINAK